MVYVKAQNNRLPAQYSPECLYGLNEINKMQWQKIHWQLEAETRIRRCECYQSTVRCIIILYVHVFGNHGLCLYFVWFLCGIVLHMQSVIHPPETAAMPWPTPGQPDGDIRMETLHVMIRVSELCGQTHGPNSQYIVPAHYLQRRQL